MSAIFPKKSLGGIMIGNVDVVDGRKNNRTQLNAPLAIVVGDAVDALIDADLVAVGPVTGIAKLQTNIHRIVVKAVEARPRCRKFPDSASHTHLPPR